jgi:cyclic peptide transporter
VANRSIEKDLNKLRDLQNDYHRYLRDLLHGFKEIKMSITRNDNMYHKYLKKHLETSYNLGVRTSVRHLNNELTGSYSWYLVLGLILFVLPRLFNLSMAETTTFVVTVLYLMGPIAALIGIVPFYTRVKIALERIHGLEKDLDVHVKNAGDHGDRTDINKDFTSITFSDVVYEYYDNEKKDRFTLGPINAEIREGEVVFITGGNGSGKSTFINLLTGLIRPTSGVISLNGFPITNRNYAYYSDQISAIFTNNHVFNENYDDFDLKTTNAALMEQIRMMQLQQVLKVDDALNSIDNRLSKGQQKRLALIYALQEKRKVIVLDEWAAEQDPAFRSYFYKTVLAELKKAGKTVVAVTHDDAYFQCADRVIKFNYGKIESDTGVLELESQLNAAD